MSDNLSDIDSRSRNWVFTLNGYTEHDALHLCDQSARGYRGIVFSEQLGLESGIPHLQGAVRFEHARVGHLVKKMFSDELDDCGERSSDRVHVAPMRGSWRQAVNYCCEPETLNGLIYMEGDVDFKQGKRTDLEQFAQACLTLDRSALIDEYPSYVLRYPRGSAELSSYRLESASRAWRHLTCFAIYGSAGVGKTRVAMELPGGVYKLNRSTSQTIWFDGYHDQRVLVIDDFYGWIPYSSLLSLLDGYQCRLDVKGGHAYAAWTTVVITSNLTPEQWYPRIGFPAALARRISHRIPCGPSTTLEALRASVYVRPVFDEEIDP
uniref:Replication-associated protein n=1 Tax=Tarsiger cyanurus CRESS-DNA-virus sp. TaxID=2815060 RepID=A0A8A4XCT2_9VIRU|nr:MAG: replication-associated protein [Tarsiger cyanurus CRESS-DNA-virus sp.]